MTTGRTAIEAAPEIITAAAQSPAGILALLVLLTAVIGLMFFRRGPVAAQACVFAAFLISALLYGWSISEVRKEADEQVPSGRAGNPENGLLPDQDGERQPEQKASLPPEKGEPIPVAMTTASEGSALTRSPAVDRGLRVSETVPRDPEPIRLSWYPRGSDPTTIREVLPHSARGREVGLTIVASAWGAQTPKIWIEVYRNDEQVCLSPVRELRMEGTVDISFNCAFRASEGENVIRATAMNRGADPREFLIRATIR